MDPQQEAFEAFAAPVGGTVYVSDGVCFRTEGTYRVINVHGVVFAHYEVGDRIEEAYAMISLFESGYASQTQLARSFGISVRSLHRFRERFEAGGIGALARTSGRPAGVHGASRKDRGRDRTILHLKEQGFSNRAIAGRLGVFENAIRKRLRRLGWKPTVASGLPLESSTLVEAAEAIAVVEGADEVAVPEVSDTATSQTSKEYETELSPPSLDADPLDRSVDRMSAALGMLDDAAPLFASAPNVSMAGVLLAIPALVASGVLPVARKFYGSLGPAFYGLRTTLVAYILLTLLRIARPENLKEHAPVDLGRIVGLDRMLEVKTLRRKLTDLVARELSQAFGRELARRRVKERGRIMGFLYIDGHVRVYHGKHKIAKGYSTKMRLAVPATSDYWVNDRKGDPLFVVTAEANAAMTQMLEPLLKEARQLLGPNRRVTIVFDRGGWSPKLFVKLLAMGFDILTYRKGRARLVSVKRFVLREARLDGRAVKYLLLDQPVLFLKGKLRLRQVTRLCDNGHQTHVLTSRWDLRDIVVAYRMFERWRQENFFKYMRQEFLLDALIDYEVEPDDPQRSVPNPERKAVNKELRKARAEVKKIQEAYGASVLKHLQDKTATRQALNAEEQKIHSELKKANERVQRLRAQQKLQPTRVPLVQAQPNQPLVKLSTERKHLTNVLKLVAYQIEGDLVNLIRPHYARTDDEGRTLIQTSLQSAATLEPTGTELRVTLAPLSSAHRSNAVAAMCETLNATHTRFPGTRLLMRFTVAAAPK